ncbi:MAG: hypothetical protein DRR42_11035 [Gammaproteobacteria bacterium]|nr:MAG: hypothetical protein DRQ44_00015 [Gammaproteobacteria bacterium]RLA51198.1 MAG: hypothetical protein DRR42_11035 [Gammaproteobacteria bacterium]
MSKSKLTWNQWLEDNQVSDKLFRISDEQANQLWNPTDLDREAAWILYTEIRSRISTQPLHYRSGDEETALDSLYRLFGITRKTIEERGPECRHFASFAIYLLNTHIRPLTAKWHKKKIDGKIQHDDDRRDFREDLSDVQVNLIGFCQIFGKIALGDEYADDTTDDSSASADSSTQNDIPGHDIPFDKILLDENVPGYKELYVAELEAISERREDKSKVTNLAGLACSGGGIRSATFCLGVAQSLSRRGLLKDIDYLSTVSGGGYFGSFLSSYLNDTDRNEVGLEPDKLPFAEENQAEPKPVRQLRNNSKYLLKGGLLGKSRMAGLLLFGIFVNLLTLFPILLGAVALTKVSEQFGLNEQLVHDGVGIILIFLLSLLLVLVLGLPLVYKFWSSKRDRITLYEKTCIFTGLTLLAIWVLGCILPKFYQSMTDIFGTNEVMIFFACLPILLIGTAFTLGLTTLVGRLLMMLAGIAGPLLLLMSYQVLIHNISPSWTHILVLFASITAVTIWLWFINVNQVSPHRYYRNRLAETYLLRKGSEIAVDPQLLSKLQSNNTGAPYHLINAAVNLPSSKNPELRGRNSDFFMFSRHFCGSPLLGYCETEDLENKDPHLDLGTAMAVSGAAASGHMGTTTIKGLSFWLSLLNIRLGYWLPNPKRLTEIRSGFVAQPFSLWKELFGNIDEKGKFVNLSDGGHIENLGIYELLRRKCKFIIAIDGEADPGMTFPSLMNVIRYAQIDFGINIQIDLGDLKQNETGFTKAHFALGEINYDDSHTGYLLYIKSSLTGNERDYILDYHKNSPSFPHETTADQFFSEAQFEAYRALGEHIGEDLFHSEVIKGISVINMKTWFTALVRNLHE